MHQYSFLLVQQSDMLSFSLCSAVQVGEYAGTVQRKSMFNWFQMVAQRTLYVILLKCDEYIIMNSYGLMLLAVWFTGALAYQIRAGSSFQNRKKRKNKSRILIYPSFVWSCMEMRTAVETSQVSERRSNFLRKPYQAQLVASTAGIWSPSTFLKSK